MNNKKLNSRLNLKNEYNKYDITSINPNTAKEFHHILITQASHQHAFEIMDKISTAFFIENRYPFFDKRLIEFCYAIPTEQKFKSGWDRFILRQSMENFLPNEVQWRPRKKFLTKVYERNLLMFGKEKLDELFNNIDLISVFNDEINIQKIYERFKTKNYQSTDARDIWKLAILILWFQNTYKNYSEP